ncbi:MAG: nucleoside kinase [Clostridiales bacterium]|nr:nucleoside kinase [Clostridiales bacterium]
MTMTLNGVAVANPATYLDAVRAALPDAGAQVLAVMVGGEARSLTDAPQDGDVAVAVTYCDAEGRRVYERSLRFLFLLAVDQLMPGVRVRLEHSFGNGIYVRIHSEQPLTVRAIKAIDARMRELAERDLPFTREDVPVDRAMEIFRAKGQMDKVRLLRHRSYDTFHLYRCGDMVEYFYGVMVPSTGYTPVFRLQFYLPGVVMMLPDPERPDRPSAFRDMPMLMHTFDESNRWNAILQCSNAADLNEMTAQGRLREFIRINEALHEKSINAIADKFAASGARLILIAGPSSSGKTTFSHRLSIALRVQGLRPMKLSLDDYYIDRDKIPLDENGQQDLERLDTLDVPLFNDHLVRLLQGETVDTPLFDFKRARRSEQTLPLRVDGDQPIIIEGIHGLNDALTDEIARGLKFKVYISALTSLNLDDHNRIRTTDVRLLRRMVRDFKFRGTPPERTIMMWPSVRNGEEKYIFPFQEQADVMFNSSLAYEMAILKKYVHPILLSLPRESACYTQARRLVKFLNYFLSSDVEDEIPPNSILREFIGGSCFYRDGE